MATAGMLLCAPVLTAGPLEESREDPRVAEIVTTGVRDKPLARLPRSANVITAEDIALSPNTNITDLLAREANVVLRSLTGSDRFAAVDIRGQGDTNVSNVLVLVDGFSINEADLSGSDFSSVALDQVDRIEVIRGANTVRYGSGAVGGVINILTREAEEGLGLNARARYGSYSTIDTGAGASYRADDWFVSADANYLDTDGYRDNGDLESKDLLTKAGISPLDWLEASVTGKWHRDEYGLPGPISAEAFNGSGSDRESTEFPFDGGETDDDRFRADIKVGTDTTGLLRLTGVTRERDNDIRLGAVSDDDPFTRIREDSDDLLAQYEKDFVWLGRQHSVFAGFDATSTDYSRDDSAEQTNARFRSGDIRQKAWFVAADLELVQNWTLSLGYRQDRFRADTTVVTLVDDLICDNPGFIGTPPFQVPVCNDPGGARPGLRTDRDDRDVWRNSAFEAGLVYTPDENTSWFISYAESFRNPNIDELLFALNDQLEPQTADNWDAGVRKLFGNILELSFALFYSETDDEILFTVAPDNTPINLNSPETVERKGGEAEARWYVLPTLRLTANAGYTRARFEDSDNTLPLVPEWTGAVSAQWQPTINWTLNVSANYVDDRVDGNDFTNEAFPVVDDYTVVDAKLSWQADALQIYGGIGNVLDEEYATSVYSNRYYPSPDRNYYVGVAYRM